MDKITWKDISIKKYEEIQAIDDSLSNTEQDVKLISIVRGIPEEEIWNWEIERINDERLRLSSLSEEMGTVPVEGTIVIDGIKCKVDKSLKSMTLSQYVDFQTYVKNVDLYKGELISTILIPVGKKYNEGYDLDDFIRLIRENLSIVEADSLLFFFADSLESSVRDTATSLAWMSRMKSLRAKGELKAKMKELSRQLRSLSRSSLFG